MERYNKGNRISSWLILILVVFGLVGCSSVKNDETVKDKTADMYNVNSTPEATLTATPVVIPKPTLTPKPTATPEPTATPKPTETPPPTPVSNKPIGVDSDGVSKDLKEFVETYEKFLDEYGAFLKRYMQACFSLDFYSLEDEYKKMEKKLDEYQKKMDELDPDIMSVADAKYYWDAIWRIEKKMLNMIL